MPDAAFYLWAKTPSDDADFARRLLAEQAVSVLPGSFLAREAHGTNPGRGYIRIALVAHRDDCAEAVDRIVAFAGSG
jgi:N-succinyldiaminopimelate aminotransferase